MVKEKISELEDRSKIPPKLKCMEENNLKKKNTIENIKINYGKTDKKYNWNTRRKRKIKNE